jgi:hypothetical protein
MNLEKELIKRVLEDYGRGLISIESAVDLIYIMYNRVEETG